MSSLGSLLRTCWRGAGAGKVVKYNLGRKMVGSQRTRTLRRRGHRRTCRQNGIGVRIPAPFQGWRGGRRSTTPGMGGRGVVDATRTMSNDEGRRRARGRSQHTVAVAVLCGHALLLPPHHVSTCIGIKTKEQNHFLQQTKKETQNTRAVPDIP